MAVKLLYFASLREALGMPGESVDLPDGVGSAAALRDLLVARGDQWESLATVRNLRVAINQRMVTLDAAVKDGDEIAFFPPVTGG